ncbi:MAG TPA: beta-N-acetylhexosaminidase [Desulfobulbaceae bacterium]|nr:beta-N-acetylhexosaminidase [Desulfobulbaceae bacterium]
MNGHDLALGQLFMVGFAGLSVDARHPVVEDITRHGLGGVILFDRDLHGARRNIESAEQLRELTAALQGYARIPLFIAVDQEGGRVCRLKEEDGFPTSLPAKLLGDEADPARTRIYAERMAASLAACGVNLNMAPVVDLDLNPANPIIGRFLRSYGSGAGQVASHASAFIAAHHHHGIACCLKHFPGHGSAAADSHLGFVDNTEQWRPVELDPFQQLIDAGYADSVMTAHVVNRQLDSSGLPATLSAPVISGLLRERLGFAGVIISDDLQMRAISDQWSYAEAVQNALLAGVDLIIVCNVLAWEEDATGLGIRAVEELLAAGRISERQVRDSLRRIAILKQKIGGKVPWQPSRPTA